MSKLAIRSSSKDKVWRLAISFAFYCKLCVTTVAFVNG